VATDYSQFQIGGNTRKIGLQIIFEFVFYMGTNSGFGLHPPPNSKLFSEACFCSQNKKMNLFFGTTNKTNLFLGRRKKVNLIFVVAHLAQKKFSVELLKQEQFFSYARRSNTLPVLIATGAPLIQVQQTKSPQPKNITLPI